MNKKAILSLMLLIQIAYAQVPFDTYFRKSTLRVDYYHTGTQNQEKVIFDKLITYNYLTINPNRLIDSLNLGHYQVKIIEPGSHQLIYSKGFSSLFNEWQTTDEAAKGASKVIHESFMMPFPKKQVIAQIWKRNESNDFSEIVGSININPDGNFIQKEKPAPDIRTHSLRKNGNPQNHVDLVILGEGYKKKEWGKFKSDAIKYSDILFNTEPFNKNKNHFNVTALLKPSADSGTDEPDNDIWIRSVLNSHFHTFSSNRYLMTFDNNTVRDIAGTIPYDFIFILVNSPRYGGGGIYQLYAVATSDNRYSDYLFLHEFGHHFGGLGDEYYASDVAYTNFYKTGSEPWEPNITALLDPGDVKWKHLVDEDTPIPTPWFKERYDSATAVYSGNLKKLLESDPYFNKVGVFEGAGYASEGLYRPSVDCIMFSSHLEHGFDPVCREAIQRVIDFYCK